MLPKPPASSSQFSKFQEGVNKFRFLSDVVFGYEGWKDSKPFRHEGNVCKIKPEQVDLNQNGNPNINFFWAAVVWNYRAEKLGDNKWVGKIQVLEITQKTIMKVLYELEQKEEYGDIKGYDVEITKTKEGDKTTYTTLGMPPKALSKEIKDAFEKTEVKLEALFKGEYPMVEHLTEDDDLKDASPF